MKTKNITSKKLIRPVVATGALVALLNCAPLNSQASEYPGWTGIGLHVETPETIDEKKVVISIEESERKAYMKQIADEEKRIKENQRTESKKTVGYFFIVFMTTLVIGFRTIISDSINSFLAEKTDEVIPKALSQD